MALIALAGSKGSSLSTLLAVEQKRRDECEERLRQADSKYDTDLDALKADRDKERLRADLLSVQIEQQKQKSIGSQESHRPGKHQ